MPVSFTGDNLIYKYLDSNLIAVSTLSKDLGKMSVYVINGVSGKIVYKFSEQDVDASEPIDMVIAENFLVCSFKRLQAGQLSRQEISVAEFYQSRMEMDTLKMLREAYLGSSEQLMQSSFSSMSLDLPVVSQMSYVLTIDVKALALTETH